jgi:hypothetical protein
MCRQAILIATTLLVLLTFQTCTRVSPIQLHPENPHYFLYRGKPTILIASGEHYGAVINADFDYTRYLQTLAADGMNHTRIWVGAYCEPEGALGIVGNTLAPAPNRLICPWARSAQPGYANGGSKFDLTRWDAAYFTRLKRFIAQAADRGIVVEVNLFCPFYEEGMWDVSPMNATNNVNGFGAVKRNDAYTLDRHGGLLAVQEQLVRKVVAELKGFDNIFYEVMNEPYVCKVPKNWQLHMLGVLVAAQRESGTIHLISMNIANGKEKVEAPDPGVSILNFHYAWPPEAVTMNYGLQLAIGENETGGRSLPDFHYRREGWAFILAGGAIYNNLDFSFTVGHEDGTFDYPPSVPGGGNAALRAQLRILKAFIYGFDFIRMTPDASVVRVDGRDDVAAYALIEPGKQYAVYLCRTGKSPPSETDAVKVWIDLPVGRYRVQWVDTLSGAIAQQETIDHPSGGRLLVSPPFAGDVARRVTAR